MLGLKLTMNIKQSIFYNLFFSGVLICLLSCSQTKYHLSLDDFSRPLSVQKSYWGIGLGYTPDISYIHRYEGGINHPTIDWIRNIDIMVPNIPLNNKWQVEFLLIFPYLKYIALNPIEIRDSTVYLKGLNLEFEGGLFPIGDYNGMYNYSVLLGYNIKKSLSNLFWLTNNSRIFIGSSGNYDFETRFEIGKQLNQKTSLTLPIRFSYYDYGKWIDTLFIGWIGGQVDTISTKEYHTKGWYVYLPLEIKYNLNRHFSIMFNIGVEYHNAICDDFLMFPLNLNSNLSELEQNQYTKRIFMAFPTGIRALMTF
jgi:hypothetical protein